MNFQYCEEAIKEWKDSTKNKEDFIGNLDEDIYIGVGDEIYQLLIKYNTEGQLKQVYNVRCGDCKWCEGNVCRMYDYKENCLKVEISRSWLDYIMEMIK